MVQQVTGCTLLPELREYLLHFLSYKIKCTVLRYTNLATSTVTYFQNYGTSISPNLLLDYIHVHVHDVTGDVERKKERKTPEAMEK